MKTASSTYKVLRAVDTSWYEWRVLQGESIYALDKLKSITVSFSLTTDSGIDIGNANAAKCDMTLIEESANWQRMAQFTIQFRICSANGTTKSEWITLGKFYTDERSEDKNGNLSIIGYDAMLKLEQTWSDKIPEQYLPAEYPITAKAWATMIQSAGLATFADITQLNDTVEFVGLNTTSTIRDVLKTIAAVHGGNWMMTTTETLDLMQFVNVDPDDTSTYFNLQLAAQSLDNSPALSAVKGVHLETEMGTVMESGVATGYVVKAICDVSTTTGISELCLSKVEDYVYQPFEAGVAYLDPRADIGDSVKIDGTIYQIMSIVWTLGKTPTATVSAPYDQEIDHEYTVPNQDTKTYRKAMSLVDQKMGDYVPWDEVSTAIEQNAESVVIAASGTYVTQYDYNQEIANIQSQLDGSIQTWSGNVVPTLNNFPAEDWITPTLKAEHVGDTYFVNSDAGIPEAGQYYRFEDNNGVYSWQLLTDSALTEALAQAAAAMAAANSASAEAQSKGRIFINNSTTTPQQPTPKPPYDVGDLWFKDSQSSIKVCVNKKTDGQQFSESDWVKRDKYIDEVDLETYLADSELIQSIQNQLDHKAETYYQSADPAIEWGGCVVGVAIAGINTVGILGAEEHIGDLWYKTGDNTTWYWNGDAWEKQDVPKEVFDQIDGKAQVFVSMPERYDEYNVGDLWVNATVDDIYSNDVLRCITPKASGEYFDLSHWVKASKYTDDTALNQFKSEFIVQPNQIKAEVEKRVIKDQSSTMSSFGWVLNESSHTWYSNAQEVMKVNSGGLTIKGNITATSGYIGTASSGFEIRSSAIRNGMTSRDDTTHDGVYIGTNGIALGRGRFKVTSEGAVTASDLTLNGGSINLNNKFKVSSAGAITSTSGTIGGFTITASSLYNGMTSFDDTTHDGVYIGADGIALGKGNFRVTKEGALYANEGYFLGLVQAGSIRSNYTDPGYGFGTFNGQGLTEYTVHGGENGQLGYTDHGGIIGANLEYSTITTDYTNSGINTSLGYANFANGVFTGANTAQVVKAAAIIDSYGNTYYPGTLAYKNHQGTNMYAQLLISTTD